MDEATQASAPASSTASQMLTPLDIQQKEFRVGTRGYKMRDVDEFLDQLTDAMTAVLAENERLRAGAPAGLALGTADLDDTNRQADEIIQRARDEAARLVAEAKAQALVAGAAGAGAATAADRAAVNTFLAQEREFLQSLAGLVQGHAESVKGMAKAARQASGADASTSTTGPADTGSAGVMPAAPALARKESEARPAQSPPQHAAPSEPEPASSAAPEETVVLQEPAPASVSRAEGEEPAEGDSSLRELFWGED
jgi:DivIVA domain-containing protein